MLIVFTRTPEPGSTKTRLIPALGHDGAADLQRAMTEHIVRRASLLRGSRGLPVEIRYVGGSESQLRDWLGDGVAYRPQGDGDLGARMDAAFHQAFLAGHPRAVIVGSDCPGITSARMGQALDALDGHDLVLGPAHDGGYYLIGLRRPVPELFDGPAWGTETVLEQTLAIAERLGLAVRLLEPLGDVDRPDDLGLWEAERERPRLSAIIPALNEERHLGATLDALGQPDGVEVLVVDAGSADGTLAVAETHKARILNSLPDRAMQQNAGAAVARGDVLLFLHADTLAPDGWPDLIEQTLTQPGVVAGAFAFKVDSPQWGVRLIERTASFRSRRLQTPYGDQGLFMTADAFRRVGGFPALPIMEDFELVRRLRRLGRIATTGVPALTSGRRWQRLGVLRTTCLNQLIILGYLLGVSPTRLAHWYNRSRGLLDSPRDTAL